MSRKVQIYDTTLRDGRQKAGLSLSLHDELEIAKRLDAFGVDYIEGGYPGSNEKDSAFFQAVKGIGLKRAKIVAFGMTCAKYKRPEDDEQLAKLLAAGTKVVTIVGKASRRQVEKTLGISLQENLRMIKESCRFLVSKGREVFFDAEHFFDGYKQDRDYSLSCIKAAVEGGASRVVLCDTNGGSLPSEVFAIVSEVKEKTDISLGIHAHNDGEMAVANTLAAVEAGADQVQVTINGYGERCGNANLCSVVPALKSKMHLECVSDEEMMQLTSLARFAAEITNFPLEPGQPYVGRNAFRDKAGMHASAVLKDPTSYRHIDPKSVGNESSVAVSELSGRSNIVMKAKEFGLTLSPEQVKLVLSQVERLEGQGYQFEDADGSLELIMMRQVAGYAKPFEVVKRDVRSWQAGDGPSEDSATVKIRINGRADIAHQVAEGDGPVNALDLAMRKCLLPSFPFIDKVMLVDYKVRVLPGEKGTDKTVRVLIDFSYEGKEWTTVGCSTDLIEASLQALADGLEYAILKSL